MKVGILGGTGKEGAGLALRLGKAGYAVVIGSRDKARASKRRRKSRERAAATSAAGPTPKPPRDSDLVVVAVPFAGHRQLLEELKGTLATKVVVDTVVPLDFKAAHTYAPPAEGSAAEEARAVLGAGFARRRRASPNRRSRARIARPRHRSRRLFLR